MLTVVCCDRGAPGSTTTALTLGAAFGDPAVVVEADPYGGDLAVRCRVADGGRLPQTPTVLTAAVAARTDLSGGVATGYAQQLGPGLRVVPGHLSAEQGAGISDWTPLARDLSTPGQLVVCDVGRIHAGSPSLPLAAVADVVVVVARGDVGAVIHLRERLARVVGVVAEARGAPPVVIPVLVVPRRQGPVHAAQLLAMIADSPVGSVVSRAGWLAWDPAAVASLEGGVLPRRSALARSARVVVDQLRDATAGTPAGRAKVRPGGQGS